MPARSARSTTSADVDAARSRWCASTSTCRWQDGAVTDDTRVRAAAPTILELADAGRQGAAARPFRPAEGRAPLDHVAEPMVIGAVAGRARPRGDVHLRGRRRRSSPQTIGILRPGDIAPAREHPLLAGRGEERSRASPRRSPRTAISTSTTPSPPRTAPMRRPRVSPTCCPPTPAARCRPSSRRSTRRSAIRRSRSPRWSAGPRSRPSSTCSSTSSTKVDHLIIGGGMANTFLAARGVDVGKSLCEHDLAAHCRARSSPPPSRPAAPSTCPTTSWWRRNSPPIPPACAPATSTRSPPTR